MVAHLYVDPESEPRCPCGICSPAAACLRYTPDVASRVREMAGKEQVCCAFLNFELTETGEEVRLTIKVPERAREVADALFEQFVPSGVSPDRR